MGLGHGVGLLLRRDRRGPGLLLRLGTLDARTHEIVGWIYFIAAFMSLVVINGIITFMLTPGGWLENQEFWTGFFNPDLLAEPGRSGPSPAWPSPACSPC